MPFDPDHLEEITDPDEYRHYAISATPQEWEAYVDKLLTQMVRGLMFGLDGAAVDPGHVAQFRDNYKRKLLTLLQEFDFQVTPRRRRYLRNTGRDMGIVAAINANAEAGYTVTLQNLKEGHRIVAKRRPPLNELKQKLKNGDEAPPPEPYCT